MELKEITLTNFRSHVKTKIAGLQRVNFFLGENGAGKSTILDAIAFALTGVCRGTDDGGRGADGLFCSLPQALKSAASVAVKMAQGNIVRGLKQGPRSQAHGMIVSVLKVDERVLRVLAAPTNLLRLPTRKQEELFFSLTGAEVGVEQVSAVLAAAGIPDIVDPADLVTPEGRASQLAYFRQRRPTLKQEIASLVYTPSELELPKADEKKRRAVEVEAAKLRQQIVAGSGALAQAAESIRHFDGVIKAQEDRIGTLAKTGGAEDILSKDNEASIRQSIERGQKLVKELNFAESDLHSLRVDASDLVKEASRISDLGASCPECGQGVTDLHVKKLLRDLEQKAADNKKAIEAQVKKVADLKKESGPIDADDLLAKISRSERAKQSAEAAIDEQKRVRETIADLKKRRAAVQLPQDKDWAPEQKKLAAMESQVESLKLAEVEEGRQLSVNTRRTALEQELEGVEKVVECLGPGGALQQVMAADGTEEMVKAVQEIGVELGLDGLIGVDLNPWQIRLGGRPIELASASEEFRVAAAFGIAFAKKAGASLVCLDGAEILFGKYRMMMQDVIFKAGLEQVFIAATTAEDIDATEPIEGCSIYQVKKGDDGVSQVQLLGQEAAA